VHEQLGKGQDAWGMRTCAQGGGWGGRQWASHLTVWAWVRPSLVHGRGGGLKWALH